MRLKYLPGAVAFFVMGAVAAALAGAPQPVKPVPTALYSGRWYEIARTNNSLQADCEGSTNDFSGFSDGAFSVIQTCHKGAPNGPKQIYTARGRVLPASANAKIRLGYFGGLISQEYWIVEQRSDEGWLVMATHDGRYLWLMSQKPTLPVAVKTEAVARIKQLGFDIGRLEYPLPGRS